MPGGTRAPQHVAGGTAAAVLHHNGTWLESPPSGPPGTRRPIATAADIGPPEKRVPMRIAAYLAHPRPGSFNHAVFDAVVDELRQHGCRVRAHDLYAEGFDPLLTASETETVQPLGAAADADGNTDPALERHRAQVAEADALVFVHPNWWGMPPAVLTGWVQRVLVPGVAYKLAAAEGEPAGLLSADRALVLNTSDTPAEREEREFNDPLDSVWRACVLPYTGITDVRRTVFRTVTDADAARRSDWLRQARALAAALLD
ncbi:Putative NADPH-quinone reductase (modulator of drug activity B) [Streptomyces qinglanensis]|uniref:Putative NADPH-quinone reductase (Modulator of drug activity B) n=2 Tax=Streptomyces qinglanensis TaxID=943816 RepID=A0A1H9TCM5_9ACTN|nr:Putative NADPH-quinone reductase (modulator of drug activity B) [Streptomyces qinglanensis]